jgi:hypothetical protein
MDAQMIQEHFVKALIFGSETRRNKLDGRQRWEDYKSFLFNQELVGTHISYKWKSFKFSQPLQLVNPLFEDLALENKETNHFIDQVTWRLAAKELTYVTLMQLAYNVGQLKGLGYNVYLDKMERVTTFIE